MARPKRLKSPTRLNLLVDRGSKKDAFALATERKVSIGRLFELLVAAEKKRDGEVQVPRTTPGVKIPV